MSVPALPDVVLGNDGRLAAAEVRPIEADDLLHGVRLLLDGAHDGVVALGRGLENVAFAVVEPAVVGAGDAALLDAPVDERRAAVRTVVGEQADAAGLVLEEDEILAEEADELRGGSRP